MAFIIYEDVRVACQSHNNFTNATIVKAMPERKIFSLGVRVKSLNVMW